MPADRDLFDLTGRKALVTGATRGIGLEIAAALAGYGAAVAITGRQPENLDAAAGQLRAGGAEVLTKVCHQGDPGAVVKLFEELDQEVVQPVLEEYEA